MPTNCKKNTALSSTHNMYYVSILKFSNCIERSNRVSKETDTESRVQLNQWNDGSLCIVENSNSYFDRVSNRNIKI